MYSWIISVRDLRTHRKFKLCGKENETAKQVYQRAKEKAQELKAKLKSEVTVELICNYTGFKPPVNSNPPRGHSWCPYCIKYRVFVWSEKFSLKRCPICSITEQDFYYKKYNGIFKKEYQDYLINVKIRKEK